MSRSNLALTGRLIGTELTLFRREPLAMTFVFVFPVLTSLVIGSSFESDDPSFEGAEPFHYYTVAYLSVALAAIGLIMIPVHLANYRERGVLRRFDAGGFPPWAFPVSQFATGVIFSAAAMAAVIASGAVAYGLTPIVDPVAVAANVAAGTVAFVAIGVFLGAVLPSARSAQAIGMLIFFPMFLLAGGGPPPDAMPAGMLSVARLMPMYHVSWGIMEPWFGLDDGLDHLTVNIGVAALATAATYLRLSEARWRATPSIAAPPVALES